MEVDGAPEEEEGGEVVETNEPDDEPDGVPGVEPVEESEIGPGPVGLLAEIGAEEPDAEPDAPPTEQRKRQLQFKPSTLCRRRRF